MLRHERHLTDTPAALRTPLPLRGVDHALLPAGALRPLDHAVFDALCRWWLRDPEQGAAPTFYDLAWCLPHSQHPGHGTALAIRQSVRRLARVPVTISGNGRITHGGLLDAGWLVPSRSLDVLDVTLPPWLRYELSVAVTKRLAWHAVADPRQRALAKRLWVYLAAESWRRHGDMERAEVLAADYLQRSISVRRDRPTRAQLVRAAAAIRYCDARYVTGRLTLDGDRLVAERLTAEAWHELRDRHAAVRRELRPISA